MSRTICIASGKGGVGKTTTSINLSRAFLFHDKQNILVDGNLSTPNVALYLGAPAREKTLHDFIWQRKKLQDVIHQHPSGIKIVPGSISVEDMRNIDARKLRMAVEGLKDHSELILIDSAAGLGVEATAAIEASDDVLIVANPELPSLTDALKTATIAKKLNKIVLGVVLNNTNTSKAQLKDAEIESFLGLPVIAKIPYDKNIKKSALLKKPVVHTHPKSKASLEFKKLAALLAGKEYKKEGFFGRFERQ